ncbi:hypothetical protein MRX96_010173 [Rhipicephalus microplus]
MRVHIKVERRSPPTTPPPDMSVDIKAEESSLPPSPPPWLVCVSIKEEPKSPSATPPHESPDMDRKGPLEPQVLVPMIFSPAESTHSTETLGSTAFMDGDRRICGGATGSSQEKSKRSSNSYYTSSECATKHQMAHTKEKRHGCAVCGKRFASRTHLIQHERLHTGEQPYACLICGRKFNRKSNLTRHEAVHTDEKLYPCSVCGRSKREEEEERQVMLSQLAWIAAVSVPQLLLVTGTAFDGSEDERLWSLGAESAAIPHYSEQRVVEGEPFSLSCRLRAGVDAGSWLKDGHSLGAGAGYEQHTSGKENERLLTLTVRAAHVSHTGEYSCSNGSPARFHHVLIVPKEGSSKDRVKQQDFIRCITLTLNETLVIPCDLLKDEASEVRWYHDGRAVGPAVDPRLRVAADGALVIDAAAHTDAGAYRCRWGERDSAALIVTPPVQIETNPETHVVDAGSTFKIDCKVRHTLFP